mmetsp:Transcript_73287/g.195450  ORF Transcript_73287/g.195450 Transcript_73287/m.195450 type:complete len:132 (-) Transcript_73287:82-477(-)
MRGWLVLWGGVQASVLHRNGTATVGTDEAALCKVAEEAEAKVYLPPKTLGDWQQLSMNCMADCGTRKEFCYRGCMNDCIAMKYRLDCTKYCVLNMDCHRKCDKLKPCDQCLQTVTQSDSASCRLKCMAVQA